jgi:hypothetical protein
MQMREFVPWVEMVLFVAVKHFNIQLEKANNLHFFFDWGLPRECLVQYQEHLRFAHVTQNLTPVKW